MQKICYSRWCFVDADYQFKISTTRSSGGNFEDIDQKKFHREALYQLEVVAVLRVRYEILNALLSAAFFLQISSLLNDTAVRGVIS